MNNFDFYSPTYFAFGKDREKDAGALVRRFGGTRVLIHYGGGRPGSIAGFVTLNADDCAAIYRMML